MGNGRTFALLVFNQPEHLESLKRTLKELSVETCCVPTCQKAAALLTQTQPHLVFTAPFVSDGSWVDIINLAERVDTPPNVIVVGIATDVKDHSSVVERGAFGFVIPPFEPAGLAEVVRSAQLDLSRRRLAMAEALGA